MGRTFRKLLRGSWHDISTIETWLNDMAKSGFHLISLNRFTARFVEVKPANALYRIKPSVNIDYSSFGWEQVSRCTMGDVYRCVDSTNCRELPITVYEMKYRRRNLLDLYWPFYFLFGMSCSWTFWRYDEILTELSKSERIILLISGACLVLGLAAALTSHITNRINFDRMVFNHVQPYRWVKARRVVFSVVYTLFAATIMIVMWS